MRKLVLGGILFLSGVMMLCTVFIVLSNIDSQNNEGTMFLWVSIPFLLVGLFFIVSSTDKPNIKNESGSKKEV